MYTSNPSCLSRVCTDAGIATLRTHFLGPHPLIEHYLGRLNLEPILRSHLGLGRQGILDHATAICVLIHNILTSPGPLYRIANWAKPIEASALGLTEEQKEALNDDRVARALDALGSERARGVWFRLALRSLKEWKLHTERIHFDTTSVTLSGQYKASRRKPVITHGYNKDHRPDLKQLVFGLNVTSDGAVPLLHQTWSGNTTDDSVHRGNFDRLKALLGHVDFVYVADSKLATAENMRHLAGHGGAFVTVLPRSRNEDKAFRKKLREEGAKWKTILRVPNRRNADGPPSIYSSCVGGDTTTAEGYRLIWFRSSHKAADDSVARNRSLAQAEGELTDLARILAKPTKKPRSRASVRKSIAAIPRRHGCSSLIKTRLSRETAYLSKRLRRGRPREGDPVRMEPRYSWKLVHERDAEALRRCGRTDGVFPLVCNRLKRKSRKDILEIYKYQPYLEKRFSQLKTELEIAPIYLKTPSRVAALIDAYFIAIAVASLIERDVRRAMRATGTDSLPLLPEARPTTTPTTPRVLEAFAGVGWHEFKRAEEVVCFPLQMTPLQKQLLKFVDAQRDLYR